MKGGNPLLKKIILITAVAVIYLILTSTIIQLHNDRKVYQIIFDSLIERSTKRFSDYQQVIDRERGLFAGANPALVDRFKGSVLLQVESKGEAWYVGTDDGMRYFLGRPSDLVRVIKALGTPLDNETIINYLYFDKVFPENLAGKFIIDRDNPTDYYYIHPETLIGYPLKQPEEALKTVTGLGTGITDDNIREIPVGEIN